MEIDIGNVIIDEELNIGELQLDFIQNILHKPNQEKEVTPTKQEQTIFADTGYELEKVIVKPIPSEYIVPIGSLDITQNGTYNVTDKATANVNIPEKQLGTKTITKNGIYKATDDNLDGYSEVDVETSGVDINDYFVFKTAINKKIAAYIKKIPLIDTSAYTEMNGTFEDCSNLTTIPLLDTSKVTSMYHTFQNCFSLTEIPLLNTSKVYRMDSMFYNCQKLTTIPLLDTSSCTNMSYMFTGCSNLTTIPLLNTSSCTDMNTMFYNCQKLTTIPLLDTSKVTSINYAFGYCKSLVDFGGLENLGQAYKITANANYYSYQLDLSYSPLTHDSLMNVINNLYDIKTKGCKAQQLILGSTNIAKLTAEEIAIATDKGFNVS